MESIISKGNTLDEAIRLGLEQLQATREQVSIEIIQHEKKRLFGLSTKQAIVKITKISVDELNDPDAKVWMEDGRLFYQCSSSEGPSITIGEGVKLFRNGEEVDRVVSIKQGDVLEVHAEEEKMIEGTWDITVDSQKMQATLLIEPTLHKRYVLLDFPPAKHAQLNAQILTEVKPVVTYEEIKQRLEQLHIVHGILEENINEALQATEKIHVALAQGTPSQEGKDGWVEVKAGSNQPKKPKMRQDGTVDYREIEGVPSVQAGDVIAVIHPAQPGIPGKRVTGEVIPVRDTFPVHVQLGKGVAMSEDGVNIMAVESGRPQVVQKGRTAIVSMIPKLVHQGDVDLSTGNVRFKGDIEIIGNVQDGMEVEAEGSVVIFQNANRAKIQAQQSIFIYQNLISGTVISGEQKMAVTELMESLNTIRQQLERMIVTVQQITVISNVEGKNMNWVIGKLIETKFQSLQAAVKKYREVCQTKREQLSEAWIQLGERLHTCILVQKAYESFAKLLRDLEEMISQNEPLSADSIELSYALNSVIHGSGDVVITGKGCYNCNIYAGGKLVIHGVLRGGEIYAQKGIYVREVGSSSGIKTVLSVPKGETIQMDHVWEGTVIRIGKKTYTFMEEKKAVCARWNEEAGEIQFEA
ncbi:jag family protein [Anoxybacillus sp. B7M1]|uniref:FapA family protein n=1 Tax=unclassified Anoxybacillus TaxID=2639704 RepID=UPI0005CD8E85|nr:MULTISPECIES: FapA family protein [unclassified Anoxybacillus]ANB58430.1 jag family protein [Anoxybacillus sp. B2M1]ANB62813.1 jag family protein [Anoxybacillus sp. B7M1]